MLSLITVSVWKLSMIKHLVCVLVLTCCVIASAKAEHGCSYVSQIKFVDDAYQVSNSGGLWRSLKVKERDFIDRFIGAIFFPDNDQALEEGHVECAYLTGSGRRVTLRYVTQNAHDSLSIVSTSYWQRAVDPLGLAVQICQDSQPDNCKFTVEKSRP